MDYQDENVTVRFACIDAPENSQTPWGPAATEHLRQLIPRGSSIQFREADTDQFGRMVAEVYAGGQNMNLQMVSEGHAVVYTGFWGTAPTLGMLYSPPRPRPDSSASTFGINQVF